MAMESGCGTAVQCCIVRFDFDGAKLSSTLRLMWMELDADCCEMNAEWCMPLDAVLCNATASVEFLIDRENVISDWDSTVPLSILDDHSYSLLSNCLANRPDDVVTLIQCPTQSALLASCYYVVISNSNRLCQRQKWLRTAIILSALFCKINCQQKTNRLVL
jgi:hypothetical protein